MSIVLFNSTFLISRAIRWQTRGQYNHEVILFDDGAVFEARFREGFIKRRWGINPVRDTGYAVMAPKGIGRIAEAREWCEGAVGTSYDWRQALRFMTRQGAHSTEADALFCSEAGEIALRVNGTPGYPVGRVSPWEISPQMHFRSPNLLIHYKTLSDPSD